MRETRQVGRPGKLSRRGAARGTALNIILISVVAFFVVRYMWGTRQRPVLDPQATSRPIADAGALSSDESENITLFRETSPSVVHITTTRLRRDRINFNLQEIPQGTGTGFIWNDRGHIVTNFHVVQNAQRARVTLADNSTWDARPVGAAPDADVAVLKIDAPADLLKPIPIGESANLQVGQKVLAIGNPFGLDQSLTTGVISALGREIKSVSGRPIEGVIQTDAAINPGNSGGPLLDSSGRLIAVNTAIYSPSGAYAGIGFAVPVDIINRVVPEIIRSGKVERPGLGILIFDDSITQRLGLRGVLVNDVAANSEAQAAGLRPTRRDDEDNIVLGDLIVAIEGVEVKRREDLFRVLGRHQVGDTVTLKVMRDGAPVQVPVKLQALPASNN